MFSFLSLIAPLDQVRVEALTRFGWDDDAAAQALVSADGDLDRATEALVAGS
jgi:hypothetical protein